MNRKQWTAVLIGFLSLLADVFVAMINGIDYRMIHGNSFTTTGSVVLFWAPYLLFAAAVIILVIVVVLVIKTR